MPSSHSQQINEIVEILLRLKPERILDVGVGFGKYGVLIREQLDLWDGAGKSSEEYGKWKRRVDGVEAYAEYLTPLHSFIYDEIFIGDARLVVPALRGPYDLVLLIDVIEHLSREDGEKLMRDLLKISRNVLVSTPKKVKAQEAVYGNEFERHISQWRQTDFEAISDTALIPNVSSLICLIGRNAGEGRRLAREKRRQELKDSVRTIFPFLARLYRFLKSRFTVI